MYPTGYKPGMRTDTGQIGEMVKMSTRIWVSTRDFGTYRICAKVSFKRQRVARCLFSCLNRPTFILFVCENIKIHYECEGGIEKFVSTITDCHHEACRVMTNGDREGRIFLSHPNTKNGLFFLLTAKCLIL